MRIEGLLAVVEVAEVVEAEAGQVLDRVKDKQVPRMDKAED